MNNIDYNAMNRAFKTGNILKELAKIEIERNRVFTDADIQTIISECNIDSITRKEIDFQKLLLNSQEYQDALNKVLALCDILAADKTEENKQKTLEAVNIKDQIYERLKNEFYN